MGSKPESSMKIDPDGKRLQIDDLIIIPNNLHSPPEGGSALKSLAQIASRYQSGTGGQPLDGSSPKKPRLDSDSKTSLPTASPAHAASASALHQQSLFPVFPPGLIPGTWPPSSGSPASKATTNTTNSSSTKSSTSSASSTSAAMNSALTLAAGFPLSQDFSKMGPEGYAQLIQLYEKHLKSAASSVTAVPATTPTPPSAIKASSTGINGSKKDASSSVTPVALSAKEKDRQKVSKPPPETKRPPRLIQTPCAFIQTNHIYTNPMVELTKAKEAVAAATAASAARDKLPMGVGTIESMMTRTTTTSILDLSCHRKSSHKSDQHQTTSTGLLNLKKESALLANPLSSAASSINLMGPSMKRESGMSHPLGFGSAAPAASSPSVLKHELKSSPFSAESLLSKSSSTTPNKTSGGYTHSMSDLVKMPGDRTKQDPMSRLSPAAPLSSMSSMPRTSPAPRSSPYATSHSPLSTGPDKSRSSPWHTPVSQASASGQKPAIPVSPVVRDSEAAKKDSLASFQSALFGLSYPPTTSTPLSMQQMTPTTYATASSLAAAQQSFAAAAAANPYLALMSMGGGILPGSSQSSMSKSMSSSFPPHLMDPATSAYYAALYSQQMYGLSSPYLGLGGGLRPNMSQPASSPGSSQAAAASALAAAAGLDPLQASALQAMRGGGRGAGGSAPSPTNPFSGFPSSLSGFPGYPSFPPQQGRKDS